MWHRRRLALHTVVACLELKFQRLSERQHSAASHAPMRSAPSIVVRWLLGIVSGLLRWLLGRDVGGVGGLHLHSLVVQPCRQPCEGCGDRAWSMHLRHAASVPAPRACSGKGAVRPLPAHRPCAPARREGSAPPAACCPYSSGASAQLCPSPSWSPSYPANPHWTDWRQFWGCSRGI